MFLFIIFISRELLGCFSLLLKGVFDSKLLFCFKHCDAEEKGYLTPTECASFLEILCRMGMVISQHNLDPYLLTLMENFKLSILRVITKKSKIKYIDIQDSMNQNAFIRELRSLLDGAGSKNALSAKQERKRSLSSPPETSDAHLDPMDVAPRTRFRNFSSRKKTEEDVRVNCSDLIIY